MSRKGGRIAGCPDAFPAESFEPFEAARTFSSKRAVEIHGWFLPLLHHPFLRAPQLVRLMKESPGEIGIGSRLLRLQRFTLESIEIGTV
jgi:hypothetical protein